MTRTVVVLLLAGTAVAAPVPKETEADRIKRQFGAVVDPDKDSKFALDDAKLTIRTAAKPHLLHPTQGMNAPRVEKAVEGDFVARVRITMPVPKGDAAPAGDGVLVYVGVFVADDAGHLAYHARGLEARPNGHERTGRHSAFAAGRSLFGGSSAGGAFRPEAVHFRVTRTGGKLRFAASESGTGWHEFDGGELPFAAKATLGLYVANPCGAAFAATFDQFTVTPAEAKPEK